MEKVRIGFIGAGGIAGRHVGTLGQLKDAHIIAFADTDLARAEKRAEQIGGATAYGDFRVMLDKEKLDAVYICVPPFVHGLGTDAPEGAVLERNLPFFVEKPLAVEYAVAESIAERVAAQNLVTAVGYHWRYLDTTERAQAILRDHPARLALGYWLDGTPGVYWWQKDALSGGQMIEQATHIFDLALYLLGDAATVYAVGSRIERPAYPDIDVSDVTTAALTFASGAIGSFSSTCLLKRGHRVGLHLFGDGLILEIGGNEILIDTGDGPTTEKSQTDPVLREDADFLAAVRGEENRIRSPYAESLKTHRITTLAAQSVREGKVFAV